MTIISPKKNTQLRRILSALFAVLLPCAVFFILENSAITSAQNNALELKKEVVMLETRNADLKESYYRIISPAKLEAAAMHSGLTLEKRPQYLTVNK